MICKYCSKPMRNEQDPCHMDDRDAILCFLQRASEEPILPLGDHHED